MSNSKQKETKEETNAKETKQQTSDTYKKLPDNLNDSQDDYSVSTADDSSGGKYSKTGTRKEDNDPNNKMIN